MAEQDPLRRFSELFEQAVATGMRDPNALCLATVGAEGRPSTRTVLLKGHDERGFVFYTNLESRKAREIAQNARVSLTFHWRELEKQIHIRGFAAPVGEAEADEYFATRPRPAQLGAWASRQSRPLSTRAKLVAEVAALEARYLGRPVPRPPFWSGFRVRPDAIEFWSAGVFRLHDRVLYEREGDGWRVTRLYP